MGEPLRAVMKREVTNMHRGGLNSINFSNRGGYFITGGEDKLVKMWDSNINEITPYFFQSFIGHTFPL